MAKINRICEICI